MEDPFWLTCIARQFPGTGENLQQQKENALVLFCTTEAVLQYSISTSKDLVH